MRDDRDRGLAAERTELAWSRTALALIACGAATVRGIPNATRGQPAIGAILLLLGGLVWLSGVPLARQRARHESGRRARASFHELAPLAFGTMLVGVAALVIATFFPG